MQYVRRHWQGQGEIMIEYANSDIAHAIDEYVHSERDRQILKRRLIDGVCFEPLAEEFDLSVRQVKNIVYKCSERVFISMAHKTHKKAL